MIRECILYTKSTFSPITITIYLNLVFRTNLDGDVGLSSIYIASHTHRGLWLNSHHIDDQGEEA